VPEGLPSIPQSRGSAEVENDSLRGMDFFSKSPYAQVTPEFWLSLDAPFGFLSWGIWAFDANGGEFTGQPAVTFDLQVPAGEEVWLGLADYSSGAWDIEGPYADAATLSVDIARHIAPDGSIFCCALTWDANNATVLELRLLADWTPPNYAPLVAISGSPGEGMAPLSVQLDAHYVADETPQSCTYEWDFDGDGLFAEPGAEAEATGELQPAVLLETAGKFNLMLRVTDPYGLSGQGGFAVTVFPYSEVLVADLQAIPESGDNPLNVGFYSGGSYSPAGSIVSREWDFDGDGSFNETGPEANQRDSKDAGYQYAQTGSYTAAVRITDSLDAQATAYRTITVTGNNPPVADLQADVLAGSAPLTVQFDASGSSDSDGSLILLEWDLNGNGYFGESGPEDAAFGTTSASYEYDTPGTYTVVFHILDNDLDQDSASVVITVSE
jgi:PKD repeat protein